MRRRSLLRGFLPAAIASGPALLYAETFLSVEQAQKQLFPGEQLTAKPITLTSDQRKAIQKASDVRLRDDKVNAWRSSKGGWFIADNVVGKHEFIDFAVALNANGSVKGVEVLTYRETYGSEVRNPKWRSQFTSKTTAQPVKIDGDIKNISGATLSSVHITDGVRRLLHTWALVLSKS
jgi:Na+-translocating ferredoxin:NAD+ oxidoreductase RnfG subunit